MLGQAVDQKVFSLDAENSVSVSSELDITDWDFLLLRHNRANYLALSQINDFNRSSPRAQASKMKAVLTKNRGDAVTLEIRTVTQTYVLAIHGD